MNPLRALQHGLGMELYGDVTHKVYNHLVNVAQMAVNDISCHGHFWELMIHPHGTKSGEFYKEMYLVLLGGMLYFMEQMVECKVEACELCLNLKRYTYFSIDLSSMAFMISLIYLLFPDAGGKIH